MNICLICLSKRTNKEMIECLYCHGWVCEFPHDCVSQHLGNCKDDPERIKSKWQNV